MNIGLDFCWEQHLKATYSLIVHKGHGPISTHVELRTHCYQANNAITSSPIDLHVLLVGIIHYDF